MKQKAVILLLFWCGQLIAQNDTPNMYYGDYVSSNMTISNLLTVQNYEYKYFKKSPSLTEDSQKQMTAEFSGVELKAESDLLPDWVNEKMQLPVYNPQWLDEGLDDGRGHKMFRKVLMKN
jgi:hypothetical protein